MAMARARPDRSSSSSSSSSSANDNTTRHYTSEGDEGPILSRLLVNLDLFPLIVRYLDTLSLIYLSSINSRFRREILVPLTPNLCCLHLFLQERTVVCPIAQFESLKDFMVKYRSFRPIHLHFTYSDQSSLMSLVPEISAPIYNSKADTTFSHPSTSPLATSNLAGVNQSISINVTSTNSLSQHHHPILQSPPARQSLLHTQHENDQPEISVYKRGCGCTPQLLSTQHSPTCRIKSARTSSSSSSTDSALSDSCGSTGEYRERQAIASDSTELTNGRSVSNPKIGYGATTATTTTTTTTTSTTTTTLGNIASSSITTYQQQQQQAQEQQQHQDQQAQYTSLSVDYYSNGSNNHTLNSPHHGGSLDHQHNSVLSDSIPVLSSSSSSMSQNLLVHGQHGFELSYWQKFALNGLFTLLLPFIRTLTIGRTDKPTMRARDEGLATVNGELSAGVCFFLARCFNVMHTMPDTALESVVWMDVTPRDVVLLVTMIELRDIMVDERYWRRGYWKIDRPCISSTDTDEVYDVDDVDDEGDWDGFYYLINQEGTERSVSLPRNRSSVTFSSEVGRHSRRNASTIRGLGANSSFNARSSSESASRSPTTTTVAGTASFSRLTIAPLPTELSVSEHFAQLVRNASSSLTTASNHLTSPASALLKQSKIYRDIPAPEPWQGFGDGISESSPQKVFPTDELPPAVQLFESLKTEIDDIAAAARSCGKGKKPSLTGHASNPWRH